MNNKTFKYDFLNLWLTGKINGCSETNEYGDFSIYIDGEKTYLDKDTRNDYYDMFDNLTEEQKKIGVSFWKEKECSFCNGTARFFTSSNKDYSISTFLTISNDFILSIVPDNDDIDIEKDYIKLPYKYCPMCGRKFIK